MSHNYALDQERKRDNEAAKKEVILRKKIMKVLDDNKWLLTELIVKNIRD